MEHSPLPVPSLKSIMALAASLGVPLSRPQAELTHVHLAELSRWNATTSLVQAASTQELLARHVAEGWMAAALLPAGSPLGAPLRCLDVGSGGGFPGLSLHVMRPDVAVSLVEPRQRKAAFLRAVARHHPEPRPEILERRLEEVDLSLPWDVVSFRGIRLDPGTVLPRLRPRGLIVRFPSPPDREGEAWRLAGFTCCRYRDLPTAGLRVEGWSAG